MSRIQFLLWLSLLILGGCANEQAITGGPEDKEAPLVIYAAPANESVNVDPDADILIRFNEQMQPTSFRGALQIWPRPPGGFELKSGWTWLKVRFHQPLDSNETYLMTLDKGAKDLRGNGLSNTYVLAFSTGNALNSGRIAGRIHGSREIRKNGELYLYRKFDTPLDELRQEPADYIFQPDDSGSFVLPYLAERGYMLFYHWDRNHNKLIDGGDYFGRPVSAAVTAQTDTLSAPYYIWPRLVKPERLKLLKASALAEGLIQIRVDRPVRAGSLEALELHSTSGKVPLLGSNTVNDDEFAMLFNTAVALKQHEDLWLRNFQDTSGFMLNSDTIKFNIPGKLDTLVWQPPRVGWFGREGDLLPGDSQAVSLLSNLPMLITSDQALKLVDTARDTVWIRGSMHKRSSLEWLFVPDTALQLGSRFRWELDTRLFRVPLNRGTPDSLLEGKLNSVNPDSLGSLKVMQMTKNSLYCELQAKGVSRKFILEPATEMVLENLPARSYTLSAYVDKNGDGAYNSGGLGPASGAEPFWFFHDEIRIRARWETDLGLWRLRE